MILDNVVTRLPRKDGFLTGPVTVKYWKPNTIIPREPAYLFTYVVNHGPDGWYTFRLIFRPMAVVGDRPRKVLQASKRLRRKRAYIFGVGFIPISAPMNIEFMTLKGKRMAQVKVYTLDTLITPLVRGREDLLPKINTFISRVTPLIDRATGIVPIDEGDRDMLIYALLSRYIRGIDEEPEVVEYIDELIGTRDVEEVAVRFKEVMDRRGIELRIGALHPVI